MLHAPELLRVIELRSQGMSIRAVGRATGHSRNTIRKILRGAHSVEMKVGHRASKLDPYRDYLRERYNAGRRSAQRLLEEVRPMGYDGSLTTLRRGIRAIGSEASI